MPGIKLDSIIADEATITGMVVAFAQAQTEARDSHSNVVAANQALTASWASDAAAPKFQQAVNNWAGRLPEGPAGPEHAQPEHAAVRATAWLSRSRSPHSDGPTVSDLAPAASSCRNRTLPGCCTVPARVLPAARRQHPGRTEKTCELP
ncbi:hypothetical protein [Micromonospora sp. MH33]|uniref:hypothetical protein n=1 Tax=Micromonospora sp. MH33 TaxID=1945509 RepID=UPI0011B1D2D7|nr:hypothetical protein [Micromonospora sp. MH33]